MRSSQRQASGTGRFEHLALALGLAIATAAAAAAPAAVVRADLVTQVGDSSLLGAEGSPVANLSYPVVTGLGELGFAGTLDLGGGASDGFVWFDGEIAWRNSEWSPELVGALTGGFGDAGEWLMRAWNGTAQLWTHNGLLLAECGVVSWGSETLTVSQLAERTVSAAGVPYWRAQLKDSQQQNYWLVLRSPTAAGGDVLFEVAPDTRFGGHLVGSQGVARFQVSGDERSKIYSVTLSVDGLNRSAVVINGALAALQGSSTGGLPGEAWYGTLGRDVATNGSGVAAFSGLTTSAGHPWVVAYRGAGRLPTRVVLREGDCVGTHGSKTPCQTLDPATEARTVALSEAGELVHLWIESSAQGGDEYLFHSCAPTDARAATLLLSRGDSVDLDDDGLGDATVDRVGLPGEQRVAFDGNELYVGAELDYGATTVEALLEIALPLCPVSKP